jgi:HEAT repeat protein
MNFRRTLSLFILVLSIPFLDAHQGDDPKKKKGGTEPIEGLKALQHPEAKVRYRACQTLADLGPLAKFAVPELRETLKDKSPIVRVKAAEALWKIEKTPAVTLLPVLLDALKEKDANVRAAAPPVIALIGAKAASALPTLVNALKDKELDVKLSAIAALGDLGPIAKGTAADLLELTNDKEFFLLEAFVGASLGNLGPGALPALTKALAAPSYDQRRVAAYALGTMGPAAAPAAKELDVALKSDDVATRRQVIRTLGKIGPAAQKSVPQIAKLLGHHDAGMRIEAALSIWLIAKDAKHLSVIVKALRDESASVRDAACIALGSMKADAKDAIEPVAKLLNDKDLRLRAVMTLGEIGPAAAQRVPDLKKLMNDKDDEVRLWSAFAYWQITADAKETLKVLEQTLATEAHYTQSIIQLGEMGSAAEPLLQTLVNLYREEDVPVDRRALATAIKKIDAKLAMKLGVP